MVDCTVGVAGTGQTSAGPVGEVPLLAVLALKAGVAALTRTLTSVWVTVVRIQNALGSAAAVTNHLWKDKESNHWEFSSTNTHILSLAYRYKVSLKAANSTAKLTLEAYQRITYKKIQFIWFSVDRNMWCCIVYLKPDELKTCVKDFLKYIISMTYCIRFQYNVIVL